RIARPRRPERAKSESRIQIPDVLTALRASRLAALAAPAIAALVLPSCFPASGSPAPARNERAALRHQIDSILKLPDTRPAPWGILIVDPRSGDTLYSHDADKLFVPASNMKLVT